MFDFSKSKVFSELRKALNSTDGAALIPYDLESALSEELLSLQPLAQLLDIGQAEGKTHEYSIRTGHPQAWFEGESTPANQGSGQYERKNVMLKIMRQWGGVTGFTKAVTERFINALTEELMGSVEGMSNTLEFSVLYGASNDVGFSGDAYQFSGILPRLYAYAPSNVIDAGGDKLALTDLDAAIAKIARHRQTRNDPRLFMMGLEMKQVADGLQTKVQLPLQNAALADGRITMGAYGNTPILETDYVTPATVSTSPACTAVVAAGGALTAATYTYKISSVTAFGEQVAGTASANVVAATTNLSADLSWTADASALLYMIWRNVAAGDYQLIDIIAAKTYDANGTVNGTVATYSDEGARAAKAIKPLASGEEQIVVVNVNSARGLSLIGKVDDMGDPINSIMSYVELARVKDSYDYVLKAYLAAKLKYPNLVSVIRHVKRA